MVSLLYKFMQACCKTGSHFMTILKVVHKSLGSHDKVIYINFFVRPVSLTRFESFSNGRT